MKTEVSRHIRESLRDLVVKERELRRGAQDEAIASLPVMQFDNHDGVRAARIPRLREGSQRGANVNATGQRGATRTLMLASLRDADDVWDRFPVVRLSATTG